MHKYCGWIDLVGKREFWRGPDRQKGGMLMIGINEAIRYLTGVFFFSFFFSGKQFGTFNIERRISLNYFCVLFPRFLNCIGLNCYSPHFSFGIRT